MTPHVPGTLMRMSAGASHASDIDSVDVILGKSVQTDDVTLLRLMIRAPDLILKTGDLLVENAASSQLRFMFERIA